MIRRIMSVCAVLLMVLGLTAVPATAAGTPVEQQRDWLVNARPPMSADDIEQHLTPELAAAVGGPDGFNAFLSSVAPLTPGTVLSESPGRLRQILSGPTGDFVTTLVVDATGRLAGLQLAPYLPAPGSWTEIDTTLRTLAPRVSFAATRIDPARGCTVVHGRDERTARPLGSMFKLYVLSALARATATGRLSWDTEVPLKPEWKSLPSGVLQDQPDGTPFTLAEYARYMISISDNTATDHLIHTLGRPAVEREFPGTANRPLMTTRNLFTLKGWHYPATAKSYLAAPAPVRRATLPLLDRVPRTAITAWEQPRDIDTLEWFASPVDICRIYSTLWQRHDPAVNAALTANDGGLALPASAYPTVWFKGGSEPGVLSLSYLAQAADGTLVTATLELSDPKHPLDEATLAPQAVALLRGALTLAAAD
ncbi:serine hydrolase [Symbioplanes lichenis]|uniref:serine hydrolase n=1 Tax=Symbioplanes lichenis TaxID=1629072 RepID=UPI00273A24D6|nr:serine hydrolase [Actinoplanes lichenis]